MKFLLDTHNELIPSVSPPGGGPERYNQTTQVMIQVAHWPGNTFRLWLPEIVGGLWDNKMAGAALQRFMGTEAQGLLWTFEGNPAAAIQAEVTPHDQTLVLEVRVTNRSDAAIHDLVVDNCLQLSQAPDFACDDFSRLYVRAGGQWQSLAALQPTGDYPFYYRAGYLSAGGLAWEGGALAQFHQAAEADHPLMVCVARDGERVVGTASKDYHFLFHNRANKNLLCLHSTQTPVPVLPPGEQATFRQKVYFVDGGLAACVAAFERERDADI